jgi:peptidoglycan/xylan/chitin deacetylase (PgdA/CDA1 family)
VKRIARTVFHAAGGLALTRWRNRGGFRVLAYHRFWPPVEPLRSEWEAQLRHLAKHYNVMPLDAIVARLVEGRPLAPHSLAITVDDGHRDFYTVAYPALKAHSLPATVFLTTDFLDRGSWLWFDRVVYAFRNARAGSFEADVPGTPQMHLPLATSEDRTEAGAKVAAALQPLAATQRDAWAATLDQRLEADVPAFPDDEYAPLDWNQVRQMSANGISFGAHTVTHPTLSSLTDEGSVAWELTQSKRRVENETQREAAIFCYPNGRDRDIGSREVEAAKDAGYRAAVTMEPGLNVSATNLFRLHRMGAEPLLDPLYFAQQCAVLRP